MASNLVRHYTDDCAPATGAVSAAERSLTPLSRTPAGCPHTPTGPVTDRTGASARAARCSSAPLRPGADCVHRRRSSPGGDWSCGSSAGPPGARAARQLRRWQLATRAGETAAAQTERLSCREELALSPPAPEVFSWVLQGWGDFRIGEKMENKPDNYTLGCE